MKKAILTTILMLFCLLSFAQGGPSVDAIKFRGKVTTAIRGTFDVPTGETWLIHNITTNNLEISGADDIWSTVGDNPNDAQKLNTLTTAQRDLLDVPVGETWIIFNSTTGLLEVAESDDVWQGVGDSAFASLKTLQLTITERNLLDVPSGEAWVIYNSSTQRLQFASDNDVWKDINENEATISHKIIPVTTGARDLLDVPTGETWIIYNTDTSILQYAESDDVWRDVNSNVAVIPNKLVPITTGARDLLDVPFGEVWMIYNLTTGNLEISGSDDVWSSVGSGIQDGANTTDFFSISTNLGNEIEIGETGPIGGTPYVRVFGGTQPDFTTLYLTNNRVSLDGYSIADINAVGNPSAITLGYLNDALANFSGGPSPSIKFISSDYTLLDEDKNHKTIYYGQFTNTTITVPSNSTTPIPVGSTYIFYQDLDGKLQFVPEDGSVDMPYVESSRGTGNKDPWVALQKLNTNKWIVGGDYASFNPSFIASLNPLYDFNAENLSLGEVSTWLNDGSGTANASQSVNADKPFVVDELGKKAVSFGVGDYLTLGTPADADINLAADDVIIIAVKGISGTTGTIFSDRTGSNRNFNLGVSGTTSALVQIGNGGQFFDAINAFQRDIIEISISGGFVNTYINGIADTVNSPVGTDQALQEIRMGLRGDGTSQYDGSIRRVLMFKNKVFTALERASVVAELITNN